MYRKLGRTDLDVSALSLGTVELGMDYGIEVAGQYGQPSRESAIRLVHAALDSGINLIDTAQAYGESEEILGRALRGRRDQVVLATKVGARRNDGSMPTGADLAQHLLRGLDDSLRKLQTDYVDIWQIHSVEPPLLQQGETLARAFDDARRSGKVRWTGGSFYGAALPEIALQADLFDVMQVTYSVLDQRLSDRFLDQAKLHGVGVMARSVLLKGVLTERADSLPDHLYRLRDRSNQFRELIAATGSDWSAAQAAIAFALAEDRISTVLVGVRSHLELEEDLAALDIQLSTAMLAQLQLLRLDDSLMLDPSTWGLD